MKKPSCFVLCIGGDQFLRGMTLGSPPKVVFSGHLHEAKLFSSTDNTLLNKAYSRLSQLGFDAAIVTLGVLDD